MNPNLGNINIKPPPIVVSMIVVRMNAMATPRNENRAPNFR